MLHFRQSGLRQTDKRTDKQTQAILNALLTLLGAKTVAGADQDFSHVSNKEGLSCVTKTID